MIRSSTDPDRSRPTVDLSTDQLEIAPRETGPVDIGPVDAVDAELMAFFAARTEAVVGIDPAFADVATALGEFVLAGGKRLRPSFAWWGWRGAGGTPDAPDAPAVLRAVSATELLHACALVHDDLIDASATRRGRPTVHVEFARRHAAQRWRGQPARFGAAVAILLGDLALSWADDMLQGAGLSAAALARAAEPWQAMRTEVLGGQYLDVLRQASGDPTPASALQIGRYKTAAYTVERPLHLGATLAGAPPRLVTAYRRYGADVGLAFQLRDDLLGVFGDPAATGKPAGDDLREGKQTLLVALTLERAAARGRDDAARMVRAAVGDPHLDEAGVDRVRDLVRELGAVQAVEQRIAALTGSALDALAAVDVDEPAAQRLSELAVAATRRTS